MFPILHLPRELRDEIYQAALTLQSPPPKTHGAAYLIDRIERRRSHAHLPNRNSATELPVWYSHKPHLDFSNLLLVNHQIRSEFLATMARTKAHYTLDVVVEDYTRLYPTWLRAPLPCHHLSSLQLNIRILTLWAQCDTKIYPKEQFITPQALVTIGRAILAILRRFLTRGSNLTGRQRSHQSSSDIKIDHLVLNFITEPCQEQHVHLAKRWARKESVAQTQSLLPGEAFTSLDLLQFMVHRLQPQLYACMLGDYKKVTLVLDGCERDLDFNAEWEFSTSREWVTRLVGAESMRF